MVNYQTAGSTDNMQDSFNDSTPSTYVEDVLRDRRTGSSISRNSSYANVIEIGQNEPVTSTNTPVTHFWDFGSLYLENKGSVARDHLASERTFLAWLRTSLSFATIGVGVTQLFKLSSVDDDTNAMLPFARPLGLLFVLTSIVTLLFGVFRYFLIQRLLIEDVFPASRLFIGALLVIVFILIVLTMVIVCNGSFRSSG